jgi:hypothetical protein
MISLFKSFQTPSYVIISSTKFLINRAQSLIMLETRSPVNFVKILMTAHGDDAFLTKLYIV